MLQAESIDYANAAIIIEATIKSFSDMRSCDSHWECLWEEIIAFANYVGCDIEPLSFDSRRKRARRSQPILDDYVLTGETIGVRHIDIAGSSSESYNIELYIPTLDHILAEMKERFHDTSTSLIKSFACLQPKSKHFLDTDLLSPLLQHYNIPSEGLEQEVLTFKNILKTHPFCNPAEADTFDMLEVLLLSRMYFQFSIVVCL
jgi:hypothetical protein